MRRRQVGRSAGETLKQYRLENGVTVEELGKVYAGGKGAARIEEIERSVSLNLRVVRCFRGAVEAIVFVRRSRVARETGRDFENRKIDPAGGR